MSSSKKEPTLFDILSLSRKTLENQNPEIRKQTVKKAYRRALLTHHPDKKAQAASDGTAADAAAASSSGSETQEHYTVDQITEAYNVLSDDKQRQRYTASITRTSKATFSSSATTSGNWNTSTSAPAPVPKKPRHKAGKDVEKVELDDMAWSGKRRLYYRACGGCGRARGFALGEDDVEDEETEYEILVECSGCARGLRVIVPPVEGEGGGGGGLGVSTQGGGNYVYVNGGPPAPKKKEGGGWGFNLGLGLGLGLSFGGGGKK